MQVQFSEVNPVAITDCGKSCWAWPAGDHAETRVHSHGQESWWTEEQLSPLSTAQLQPHLLPQLLENHWGYKRLLSPPVTSGFGNSLVFPDSNIWIFSEFYWIQTVIWNWWSLRGCCWVCWPWPAVRLGLWAEELCHVSWHNWRSLHKSHCHYNDKKKFLYCIFNCWSALVWVLVLSHDSLYFLLKHIFTQCYQYLGITRNENKKSLPSTGNMIGHH